MVGFFGLLLVIGGSVLFALVTLATGVLSRVGAAVLAAGAAINIGAWVLLFTQGGIQSGTDQAVELGVLVVGLFAYAVGWILLGIDAVRRDRSTLATGRAAA